MDSKRSRLKYADLTLFDDKSFSRGAQPWKELVWRLVSAAVFHPSWLHMAATKCKLLRLFGAKIGKYVNIKPNVRITFPWRLEINDHSWIGEDVWIDNLETVTIGRHCCISQGAYLCTGSHDWASERFDLVTKPINIEDYAWLSAKTIVGPGVNVGEGSVLTLGSVATENLKPGWIYQGNPASPLRERKKGTKSGSNL